MLTNYPQFLNFFLGTYATDEEIREAYGEVLADRQRTGQTELKFARTLWATTSRCGNVLTASRLKSMFADNLDKPIRSQIRNYLANRKIDCNALRRYAQGIGEILREGRKTTPASLAKT